MNGLSILLKWKTNDGKNLWKQSRFAVIASVVLTLLMVVIGGLSDLMLIILALSSSFALFVNGEIAWKIFKGKKTYLGAYVAHTGIALFLVGVLATAGHSQQQKVDLVKGEKVSVLGHDLTFIGYEPFEAGTKYRFNVKVEKGGTEQIISPVMFISDFNNSLMREPDILVGLTKDYYIEPVSFEDGTQSSESGAGVVMKKGSSYNFNGAEIFFNQFILPKDMSAMTAGGSFRIGVSLTAKKDGKEYQLEPYMENSGQGPVYNADEESKLNMKVNIKSMNASNAEAELVFSSLDQSTQTQVVPKETLSVEASIKPFISLIWLGVIVLVTGFLIAAFRRTKESVA